MCLVEVAFATRQRLLTAVVWERQRNYHVPVSEHFWETKDKESKLCPFTTLGH